MLIEFLAVFIVCYIWHALGVAIGYHRLLSHHSFHCPKFVEYFFVLGGYLTLQGSPIWWATMHRAHHRYSDTEMDPHSPKNGLLQAHHGWIKGKNYQSHINPNKQCKDLINDPIYKFLEQGGDWHRSYVIAAASCIGARLLVLALFGWVPALAFLAAGLTVFNLPFILNIVCHIPKLGYKNFETADDSVNVWWMGLISMGESWHNNHHANPGLARAGMKLWEFDMSWQVIKALKALGLVNRVRDIRVVQVSPLPIKEIEAKQLISA